jgi:O-antigen chain-terminating methyltransferase
VTEGSAALDDVLERLQQRIEQRRADGTYPVDLEEQLATHYEHIVAARSSLRLEATGRLEERLEDVRKAAHFEPRPAPMDSRVPGGRVAHRALNPFVARHADDLRRQIGEYATKVTRALDEIRDFELEVSESLRRIHDLVRDSSGLFATLHEVENRVAGLSEHQQPPWFRPWFTNDAFEAAFRGTRDEILERYRDLVDTFDGCSPVLDIGCGRGEILELLGARGIEARGVEIDPELVRDARVRGLDVEAGNGLAILAALPDNSLGGVVLIQVIEHLSPQQIADLAPLAARKVRDGGRVVVETVNPQSLYVFGHALYLDPTHIRLVHPLYLEFLFREAGFTDVRIEWRSLPGDDERLAEVPTDDPSAEAMNPLVRRLNDVLFGPQDYAVIATR